MRRSNPSYGTSQFLPEPVAAARAFGAASVREELALIADFGGGTSDFTVRVGPRPMERGAVLAVGGVAVAGDALATPHMLNSPTPMTPRSRSVVTVVEFSWVGQARHETPKRWSIW